MVGWLRATVWLLGLLAFWWLASHLPSPDDLRRSILFLRGEDYGDPDTARPRFPGLMPPDASERCTVLKKTWAKRGCGGSACDVVLVGDSITEALSGWYCYNARQKTSEEIAFGDTFKFYNRSLVLAGAGDQTANAIWLLQETLPLLQAPRAFFVMIGTNNVGTGHMSAGSVAAGIRGVVDALHKKFPDSLVLLHAITPRADDDLLLRVIMGISSLFANLPWQGIIDKANVEMSAWAAEERRVQWVDCNYVFPRGGGEDAKKLMPDLLHPNAEGYRSWFECLNPIFEEALRTAA